MPDDLTGPPAMKVRLYTNDFGMRVNEFIDWPVGWPLPRRGDMVEQPLHGGTFWVVSVTFCPNGKEVFEQPLDPVQASRTSVDSRSHFESEPHIHIVLSTRAPK